MGRGPALIAATGKAVDLASWRILLQPFLRACAHLAAKGAGQRRRTFVADLIGDQGDGAAFAQTLLRQADAPVRQVVLGGSEESLTKMCGKARPRHARAI